ncbi:hypothetical protein TRM7557_03463 [Tritonibacter multivorans]|uniref:Antibiotic biosynthesis monooxygenase n=1 Tax=Tritonibacter multivorans TaxID=928856 RepID=A0A0P1GYV9_9RHOB|nr:hypothetical protein [Tritonibacter multivorans]MDA7420481.1 hypothetical protein [Tritonibacter multivorans]CUH81515.1 hypothetical protein TRM7557_03463 [Tritonibacter multivorans]SFC37143.1 hypothetical protein SAMN04488049_102300 [Tritonibacter multivorans]
MTVSFHITYNPVKECFDDVLKRIQTFISADLKNPDRLETRLFSNRDESLIRAYSTWTNEEAFYAFMNAAIDQGAFADQGRVLEQEMQVQVFAPEPLGED